MNTPKFCNQQTLTIKDKEGKGEEIMTKQKEKRSPRSRERRGRDRWKAGRKWMQEDADHRLLPKYQHSR